MNSFKDIAYQILKEAGKPLHYREITDVAIKKGLLRSEGKTPWATMNAQLAMDIKNKGEASKFHRAGPGMYAIEVEGNRFAVSTRGARTVGVQHAINKDLSSKQKGDLAEARVVELITLYGAEGLLCYRPMSDDEGIDLIVKTRGGFKTMFLQIKSRFGTIPNLVYTATVKRKTLIDNYSMALVFCYFDLIEGDLWNYLWFVPALILLRWQTNFRVGKDLVLLQDGKRRNQINGMNT